MSLAKDPASDHPSSMPKATPAESFETALERLEKLVSELETGDVPLENSLIAFEEAQTLIKFCEQKLQTAEKALRLLSEEADQNPGTAPEDGAAGRQP